ncbi:NAD(P)/FAD-dependent oxidoreductase [Rhodobacter ferrooxidans]|uniref:FAD dependent oxidoreductase n=1 Tax=Rhodobacter ferrooxidans TaxID=371731 RepID=C8RZZ9_9RHOB|nr:FAD-dependent oxidoreductase [Rhodobacter sp. SW2]EEW25608.1 FAD dependent oxidoreductase [Rhodobacter sp. SW2]
MTQHRTTDIAVIGAGVVGMTIALRLAQAGREVVLIDPAPPGMGASYGNAGTVADYAVMPVGTPGVLRNLPSLMFDRNSPLSIRHTALPSLAPWLMRFARQCLPGHAARNAQAIAALLATASPSWRDLAAEIGGAALMQQRGCLYLYQTEVALRGAAADLDQRRRLGIAVETLDPAQVAALEPGLPAAAGGAFFPQARFLTDPGRMMQLLAGAVTTAGVELLAARVEQLQRLVDGVALTGPGLQLHARTVVIAAGAHSRRMAAMAGDAVPLDTERGYHVEWEMPQPKLSRPVCPTARGFYLCPMDGRLRVAGTVELGGLTAPPSPHRIARLVEGARTIFPDLGAPDREWMGFRPSMPDSLPVIGPSRAGAEVIHAYGHGHIGLTLAPITARLVCDVIAGRPTEVDMAPYLPGRF